MARRWIVTGTSMEVEADNEQEAIERADQSSGWHWEATEVVVDDAACRQAGEHQRSTRHRWQECPVYHDDGPEQG